MFNRNSGLVQVWVRLIKNGTYEISNIPNLSNLKQIVIEVLNEN